MKSRTLRVRLPSRFSRIFIHPGGQSRGSQEAQAVIQAHLQAGDYKYEEYRINRHILVGKMKDRLIVIAWEPNGRKREAAWKRLRGEVVRHLLPVLRGRTAQRDPSAPINKYSQNGRRRL
ncbi:MAG: hypothetical protein M0Z53_11200 [Thermaerobacter sp.]|nr:hypothetical protein [Thermaerobacter sp.]